MVRTVRSRSRRRRACACAAAAVLAVLVPSSAAAAGGVVTEYGPLPSIPLSEPGSIWFGELAVNKIGQLHFG